MKDARDKTIHLFDQVLIMNSKEEGPGGVIGEVVTLDYSTQSVTVATNLAVSPYRNSQQSRTSVSVIPAWLVVLK